jgi:hypothetical protein
MFLEHGQVGLNCADGISIVLFAGQLQQIPGFDEAVIELDDGIYNAFQPGPLLAQALCTLWIVPDIGILELALDLLEPLALRIEVKDTPSERRHAPACS